MLLTRQIFALSRNFFYRGGGGPSCGTAAGQWVDGWMYGWGTRDRSGRSGTPASTQDGDRVCGQVSFARNARWGGDWWTDRPGLWTMVPQNVVQAGSSLFFFFPYFFLISSRISSLPERTSISTPALPKAVTRPRRRSAMLGRWADPLQSLQPILNLGKGLQFPCHVVLYRSNEYSGTPRLMTRLLFLYNYVL